MNQTMCSAICFVLVSSFTLHPSSHLQADGGTVRLVEHCENYRLAVFTTPTPVRAGPVDVSVLVQEADTGELAAGIHVTIQAESRDSRGVAIERQTTTESATNKLYYAAAFDLPEPGWYSVEVSIDGPKGKVVAHFDMEAADPLPSWLAVWPWVAWPGLAILLFGVHQVLVRRRLRHAMTDVPPRAVIRLPH
jgi:hypothetical protein